MKVKTNELSGAALDWAVAKCEGASQDTLENFTWRTKDEDAYSTEWSLAGPIVEREGINIFRHNKLDPSEPDNWCGHKVAPRPNMEGSTNMVAIAPDGPTALIAAMRCYVTSRLGNEVDVPEELLS